jgi:tellurite resistance protein TerA
VQPELVVGTGSRETGLSWRGIRENKGGGDRPDLGCLFELSDGRKGAVQALGNTFGTSIARHTSMAGDDRTGANSSGEFLYINGDHLKDLDRVCIYAFIYEGVANWGKLTAS